MPIIAAAGTVCVNRGHLYLDAGDLYKADDEARAAYALGEEKHDYILMARARLLECMVENTKLDEEIEDSAWVAHLALEAQRRRWIWLSRTENRRLLARALIWHGLTLSNTSPGNLDAARDMAEQAAALLRNEVHDHIWDDLQTLKNKVVSNGSLDCHLAGLVAGDRGRPQLPATHRGFRRSHHSKNLGARRAQSGARGPAAVDFSEKSSPDIVAPWPALARPLRFCRRSIVSRFGKLHKSR